MQQNELQIARGRQGRQPLAFYIILVIRFIKSDAYTQSVGFFSQYKAACKFVQRRVLMVRKQVNLQTTQ